MVTVSRQKFLCSQKCCVKIVFSNCLFLHSSSSLPIKWANLPQELCTILSDRLKKSSLALCALIDFESIIRTMARKGLELPSPIIRQAHAMLESRRILGQLDRRSVVFRPVRESFQKGVPSVIDDLFNVLHERGFNVQKCR